MRAYFSEEDWGPSLSLRAFTIRFDPLDQTAPVAPWLTPACAGNADLKVRFQKDLQDAPSAYPRMTAVVLPALKCRDYVGAK